MTMSAGPLRATPSKLAGAWEVLAAMTVAAIRQDRDFTPLGVAKWVIEPLVFMVVYFILLVAVVGRTGNNFMLFLLCALLPFRYFSGVAGGSLSLIRRHSSILTNRVFPRSVLPLVLMGAEGFTFCISLVLLAPLMVYYDIPPSWALLWLPAALLVLGILTAGCAYLAAVIGLYAPDFRALIQNLIRVAFFMSTALVRRTAPGKNLQALLESNPLSGVFDAVRFIVIRRRPPAAEDLLYPLVVGVVLLAIGLALYRWREPHFAKEA